MLLPGTDEPGATALAHDIRMAVRALGIEHTGSPLGRLAISIGVAALVPGRPPADPGLLVRAADQALYAAKSAGRDAIRSAGLDLPERPHHTDLDGRLVNVFLKCEVSQDGQVRGRRNAMLDDSDVHWHRQIKACVGGVVASVTGDPAVFVSVAAVHQGPSGGGPVIAIVDHGA